MSKPNFRWFLLLLVILPPGSASAQEAGLRVKLVGAQEGAEVTAKTVGLRQQQAATVSTETDSSGVATLTLPSNGAWRVTVEQPGFVRLATAPTIVNGRRALEPLELEVGAARSISVLDSQGRPISDALVAFRCERAADEAPDETGCEGSLRSNEAGGVEVRLPSSGVTLLLLRLGFEPLEVFLESGVDDLEPGTRFVLKALAWKETALPSGSTVLWKGTDLALSEPSSRETLLPPNVEALAIVELKTGERRVLRSAGGSLSLASPVEGSLAVLDDETSDGVLGARIYCLGGETMAGIGGQAGKVEIPCTDPKSWAIVWAPDYISLLLKAEDAVSLESVTLIPWKPCSGRLLDGAGKGVPGVPIGIVPKKTSRFRWNDMTTFSDSAGDFTFDGAVPRWLLMAQLDSGGFVEVGSLGSICGGTARMPDLMSVRGRVEDESGSPLVADVQLVPSTDAGNQRSEAISARSQASGMFEFGNVEQGVYDLIAQTGDRPIARVRGVEVREGEGADLEPLVMPCGFNVEGRLVDPGGSPLPGSVTIEEALPERRRVSRSFTLQTGDDGYFTLECLSPLVRTSLTVESAGYRALQRDVPNWESSLTLELEPTRGLAGAVVGAEAEGGTVRILVDGRELQNATFAEDGEFEFPSVPTTDLSIFAVSGSKAARLDLLEEELGERVSIKLEDAFEISGTIVKPTGKPIDGAVVLLVGDGPSLSSLYDQSDESGRFLIAGILPKQLTVRVRHPIYSTWSQDVSFDAGNLELDVVLRQALELHGVVLSSSGNQVPDATVECHGVGAPGRDRTVSRADGSFECRKMPEGMVSVSIGHGQYGHVTMDVEVGPAIGSQDFVLKEGLGTLIVDIKGLTPEEVRVVELRLMHAGDVTTRHIEHLAGSDHFEVDGLEEGQWIAMARVPGRELSAEKAVDVRGRTVVALEFGKGVPLTGVIRRGAAKRLAQAAYWITNEETGDVARVVVDGEGYFAGPPLPLGRYIVRPDLPGLRGDALVVEHRGEPLEIVFP